MPMIAQDEFFKLRILLEEKERIIEKQTAKSKNMKN